MNLLRYVLNYPNPFVNILNFGLHIIGLDTWCNTSYDNYGKVVWQKIKLFQLKVFLSKEITWDGKDDFGNKIGKGVYIYKPTQQPTNKRAEKFENLW
jgi:flagellar hook assembly protein FlgD